jgi:hypothetical protein
MVRRYVLTGVGVVVAVTITGGALLAAYLSSPNVPLIACMQGITRMAPQDYAGCVAQQAEQLMGYWQAQRVYRADPASVAHAPAGIFDSSSLWHLGAVLTPSRTRYHRLYLLAYPPGAPDSSESLNATLNTVLAGVGIYHEQRAQYEHQWEAPQDIGTIRITAVTSPAIVAGKLVGKVSFITDQGHAGSFDLATETWVIYQPTDPEASPTAPRL